MNLGRLELIAKEVMEAETLSSPGNECIHFCCTFFSAIAVFLQLDKQICAWRSSSGLTNLSTLIFDV